MSTIPTIVVTPSAAADAYARVDRGDRPASGGGDFGATLQRALQGAVDNLHAADAQGHGGDLPAAAT